MSGAAMDPRIPVSTTPSHAEQDPTTAQGGALFDLSLNSAFSSLSIRVPTTQDAALPQPSTSQTSTLLSATSSSLPLAMDPVHPPHLSFSTMHLDAPMSSAPMSTHLRPGRQSSGGLVSATSGDSMLQAVSVSQGRPIADSVLLPHATLAQNIPGLSSRAVSMQQADIPLCDRDQSSPSITTLLSHLAKLQAHPSPSILTSAADAMVEDEQLWASAEPVHLIALAQCFTQAKPVHTALFEKIADAAVPLLSTSSSPDISHMSTVAVQLSIPEIIELLQAFADAKVSHPKLMDACAEVLQPVLVTLPPSSISTVLSCFADCNHAARTLFSTVAKPMAQSLSKYTPKQLVAVLWSYAFLGIREPALFAPAVGHLQSCFHKNQLQEFAPNLLARAVWAFATVEVYHPLLFACLLSAAAPGFQGGNTLDFSRALDLVVGLSRAVVAAHDQQMEEVKAALRRLSLMFASALMPGGVYFGYLTAERSSEVLSLLQAWSVLCKWNWESVSGLPLAVLVSACEKCSAGFNAQDWKECFRAIEDAGRPALAAQSAAQPVNAVAGSLGLVIRPLLTAAWGYVQQQGSNLQREQVQDVVQAAADLCGLDAGMMSRLEAAVNRQEEEAGILGAVQLYGMLLLLLSTTPDYSPARLAAWLQPVLGGDPMEGRGLKTSTGGVGLGQGLAGNPQGDNWQDSPKSTGSGRNEPFQMGRGRGSHIGQRSHLAGSKTMPSSSNSSFHSTNLSMNPMHAVMVPMGLTTSGPPDAFPGAAPHGPSAYMRPTSVGPVGHSTGRNILVHPGSTGSGTSAMPGAVMFNSGGGFGVAVGSSSTTDMVVGRPAPGAAPLGPVGGRSHNMPAIIGPLSDFACAEQDSILSARSNASSQFSGVLGPPSRQPSGTGPTASSVPLSNSPSSDSLSNVHPVNTAPAVGPSIPNMGLGQSGAAAMGHVPTSAAVCGAPTSQALLPATSGGLPGANLFSHSRDSPTTTPPATTTSVSELLSHFLSIKRSLSGGDDKPAPSQQLPQPTSAAHDLTVTDAPEGLPLSAVAIKVPTSSADVAALAPGDWMSWLQPKAVDASTVQIASESGIWAPGALRSSSSSSSKVGGPAAVDSVHLPSRTAGSVAGSSDVGAPAGMSADDVGTPVHVDTGSAPRLGLNVLGGGVGGVGAVGSTGTASPAMGESAAGSEDGDGTMSTALQYWMKMQLNNPMGTAGMPRSQGMVQGMSSGRMAGAPAGQPSGFKLGQQFGQGRAAGSGLGSGGAVGGHAPRRGHLGGGFNRMMPTNDSMTMFVQPQVKASVNKSDKVPMSGASEPLQMYINRPQPVRQGAGPYREPPANPANPYMWAGKNDRQPQTIRHVFQDQFVQPQRAAQQHMAVQQPTQMIDQAFSAHMEGYPAAQEQAYMQPVQYMQGGAVQVHGVHQGVRGMVNPAVHQTLTQQAHVLNKPVLQSQDQRMLLPPGLSYTVVPEGHAFRPGPGTMQYEQYTQGGELYVAGDPQVQGTPRSNLPGGGDQYPGRWLNPRAGMALQGMMQPGMAPGAGPQVLTPAGVRASGMSAVGMAGQQVMGAPTAGSGQLVQGAGMEDTMVIWTDQNGMPVDIVGGIPDHAAQGGYAVHQQAQAFQHAGGMKQGRVGPIQIQMQGGYRKPVAYQGRPAAPQAGRATNWPAGDATWAQLHNG